ncbi:MULTISPECIES: hypothetical protein [Bacillaceae]|uniref:Helicase XPB/Ssl2 N-terminal domain-containing protein n=1 Tax=Evansella alkalicola TaxID=745819 RepID=A0ABS6JPH8_9BACI|nr:MULTISPECIES: hypothetical protein [Bacillaceae]MBU9720469.1 hypothetical protein [Bacillus alkalicola]
MILRTLNKYLAIKKDTRDLYDSYNKLSKEDNKILMKLTLNPSRNKKELDRWGVEAFGPFNYYQSLKKIHDAGLLYLGRIGNKPPAYLLPREIDAVVTEDLLTEEDEQQNHSDSYYFSLSHFFQEFLLQINYYIQGEGNTTFLDENQDQDTKKALSSIVSEIFCNGTSYVSWMVDNSLDNLLESVFLRFVQKYILDEVDYSNFKNMKSWFYGRPITESHFSGFQEQKVIWERIQSCSVFKECKEELGILELINQHGNIEAIHLQSKEWLLPRYNDPAFLYRACIFSEIIGTGQTMHVTLTEKSVQNGKKHATLNDWSNLTKDLSLVQEDKEALWWLGRRPIIKHGTFIFYEIKVPSLLNQLFKEALKMLSEYDIFKVETGVLISSYKIKEWEEFLDSVNFPLKEYTAEDEIDKEQTVTMKFTAIEVPEEWEQINNLPPINFQLMSYRENMKARLIRQSQALKLPVIYENTNGDKQKVEIKTLSFQGEKSIMKTFNGEEVDLLDVKRLAILDPSKELSK